MLMRWERPWRRLGFCQQFMLASLVILLAGMAVTGWWVAKQIEAGAIGRAAATAAFYVDRFVAPHLQHLDGESLTAEHVEVLGEVSGSAPLSRQMVGFKLWDGTGRILYSAEPDNIGRVFPVKEDLARAWRGEVVSNVSDLQDDENVLERGRWTRLVEIYSPIRLEDTGQVVAVAEFYQTVDVLGSEAAAIELRWWALVSGMTLGTYLLLALVVRRSSRALVRERSELDSKVGRLTEVLAQTAELHERVSRAAARTTTLNERLLRRIGTELHRGPAQDLSLALLQLDGAIARAEEHPRSCPRTASEDCPRPCLLTDSQEYHEDLPAIQATLQRALQEVRVISRDLRLPELDDLTLVETVARAARVSRRQAGATVALCLDGLPEQGSLPVKITLYRVVQECLANACRHGGGLGMQVSAGYEAGCLTLEVSDQGPGFDWSTVSAEEEHLGLAGVRERVESLGGIFRVESEPGRGTRVMVVLPFFPEVAEHE